MTSNKMKEFELYSCNRSQWNLNRLQEIGNVHDINFHLPPFSGNINEAAFDVERFNDDEHKDVITALQRVVESIELKAEYGIVKGRLFLVVELGEM
tara:strand:+ start:2670 stop:2957 length:288 start_codon:yes stop_codon:yes gene_type:complete